MGCFVSTPEKNVVEEKKEDPPLQKDCKILILGSGCSGKSTLFKSIRFLNNKFYEEDCDVSEYKTILRQNCVHSLVQLLKSVQLLYDENPKQIPSYTNHIKDPNEKFKSSLLLIIEYNNWDSFTENPLDYNKLHKLAKSMQYLWNLPPIQEAYNYMFKQKYFLIDNMDYFLNKINDIMSDKYIPNQKDILKIRKRTTGIITHKYKVNDTNYRFMDVGGQRNSRKKWIHNFENISFVFFVVGLSDFCKALYEDEQQNALLENLALFEEVAGSKWFTKTKLVLILNKMDLFQEYLRKTPLTICFGDEYKGRNYNDNLFDKNCKNVMNRLLKKLYDDIDDLIIPNDVINVISMYFDEYWLYLCVQDGIQFIKHKWLSVEQSISFFPRKIAVHTTTALYPQQTKHILEKHNIKCLVDTSDLKDNNDHIDDEDYTVNIHEMSILTSSVVDTNDQPRNTRQKPIIQYKSFHEYKSQQDWWDLSGLDDI